MDHWRYHIQAGSVWPPFGSDTELQTLFENFGDGSQLLQCDSDPLPGQGFHQQIHTFQELSTCPGLQNRSYAVVHQVRSGDCGSQSADVMKSGECTLPHSCILFALWARVKSCRNVHFASPKCCWVHGSTTASMMSCQYMPSWISASIPWEPRVSIRSRKLHPIPWQTVDFGRVGGMQGRREPMQTTSWWVGGCVVAPWWTACHTWRLCARLADLQLGEWARDLVAAVWAALNLSEGDLFGFSRTSVGAPVSPFVAMSSRRC